MKKFLLMVALLFVLGGGGYGVLTRVVNACACACAIGGPSCGCTSRCSGCGVGEGLIKGAECCIQARENTPCESIEQ